MSERKVYVYNSPINGQISLTDCDVVINDRCGQVIINGGRLVNNGSLGMTINNSTGQTQKVYMPDPKAEQELYRVQMENKKLRAENERLRNDNRNLQYATIPDLKTIGELSRMQMENEKLRTENKKLRSDKKDEPNADIKEKYVVAMKALAQKEKQLMKALSDLEYIREQREALKEVNKEQAERIRKMKEKKQYNKHEYEPTKDDIAFINSHIELFLEEDIIDYYELKKKDYYEEEDFIP